ncbi:MAG: copper chaperone PCu(A)C, partial [Anaerolineae bacterium]|nr:copper chaperone PCu(A)C [Anaerolineae bacterium]
MKRLILGLFIGLMVMMVGAVSAHDHGVHIRVAHLSATAPSVDVYVGELLAIRSLSFGSTSGYIAIDGNMADVNIVPAGGAMSDAVYGDSLVFAGSDNGYFTVVALGDLADFTFDLVVLPEDAQPLGTALTDTLIIRGAFARPTAQATPHSMDMAEATAEATMQMGGHNTGGMNMGRVSGMYMVIENSGDSDDTLIGAVVPISNMVQIHQTTVTDGVAQMGELENGLDIPAGGVAELRPGGYHIMLMDLTADLVEGET